MCCGAEEGDNDGVRGEGGNDGVRGEGGNNGVRGEGGNEECCLSPAVHIRVVHHHWRMLTRPSGLARARCHLERASHVIGTTRDAHQQGGGGGGGYPPDATHLPPNPAPPFQ
jgi:hypothetical protein